MCMHSTLFMCLASVLEMNVLIGLMITMGGCGCEVLNTKHNHSPLPYQNRLESCGDIEYGVKS